jgi:hypothetical protein
MEGLEIDKGQQGAKRSSWEKVHYRDLALRICEDHPDLSVDELATLFECELQDHPAYLRSIAVYVMANTRASLTPRRVPSERAMEDKLVTKIAAKAAQQLMAIMMPNDKPLRHCTGAECIKFGGWLTQVGRRIGDKAVVGDKLTEADLQKMFRG